MLRREFSWLISRVWHVTMSGANRKQVTSTKWWCFLIYFSSFNLGVSVFIIPTRAVNGRWAISMIRTLLQKVSVSQNWFLNNIYFLHADNLNWCTWSTGDLWRHRQETPCNSRWRCLQWAHAPRRAGADAHVPPPYAVGLIHLVHHNGGIDCGGLSTW